MHETFHIGAAVAAIMLALSSAAFAQTTPGAEVGTDVAAGFARYERTRRPIRDKLNKAVELSAHWYERMASKMQMQPHEFTYDYLLRTNIMTAERLAKESPGFIKRYWAEALLGSA